MTWVALAGLGLSALSATGALNSSGKSGRISGANNAFIQGLIPNQITTNFPTGSNNFVNEGGGVFTNTFNGGLSTVHAPQVNTNFSQVNGKALEPFIPQFQEVGGRFNAVGDEFGAVGNDFGGVAERFQQLKQDFEGLEGPRGDLATLFDDTGKLLPLVAPGQSRMRDSVNAAFDTALRASQQDLRGAAANRRISGSSFARDDLSRLNSEFARNRSGELAKTFLAEVDTTAKILDFQRLIVTESANILAKKLTGQGEALLGETQALQGQTQALSGKADALKGELASLTESRNTVELQLRHDDLRAQLEQNAEIANQGATIAAAQANLQAEIASIQLAFGGQQQALNHIANLANSLNGATANQVNALGSRTDLLSDLGGAGLAIATGSQSGPQGTTSSGSPFTTGAGGLPTGTNTPAFQQYTRSPR